MKNFKKAVIGCSMAAMTAAPVFATELVGAVQRVSAA